MDPTPDTLCPGCFAHKGQGNPCPHCGYDDRAERSPLLLPHRTLLNGQFVVGRVVGKPGGFGITYLGWDLNLETRVAIKEYLPRDLAGRAGDRASVAPHSREDGDLFRYGLEQFLREARTLAQLDHPNIVRVRQFFEAHGTAYLVMDYYQGLSLGEHLERQGGRLPEDIAKRLMLPVLDGLRAVHAKGFLHRDIKPENIYLARMDSGGVRPILLDFGAARQAMSERSRSLSVVVSAGYAPFEQYQRRGNQGPWTDVYSAAAVLYRLVTGEPPPEAIERVSGDEIKPAASFGVSERMSDALGEALALAPEARPQTVPEFQGRLWGARPLPEPDTAATSPIPSSAPTPEHRSVQSAPPASPETEKGSASAAGSGLPSRRWLWPTVLAVVLTLLGSGVLYQYRQSLIATELRQDAAEESALAEALAQSTETAHRADLGGCGADGCGNPAAVDQRLQDLVVETAPTTETTGPAAVPTDGAREAETVPPPPTQDLNALLQTCQEHFAAQRYTVGKEGTALACYREVLSLDSGNAGALSALAKMEGQYHRWATDALARGDLDKTRSYIERMRQVNPASPAAEQLMTRVEGAIVSISHKPAEPLLSREQALAQAVRFLIGDPYGSTAPEVKKGIESAWLSQSGYSWCTSTKPLWIFHVVVKAKGDEQGFDGFLMLDARNGYMKCHNLPALD